MDGCNHTGIAGPVAFNTNEGFDGRLSDDFVVVLTHPRLLAGDVGALEHRFQQGRMIGRTWRNERCELWRAPLGFKFQLRHTVVKEFNGQVRNGRFVVAYVEHARGGERCDSRGFDLVEISHGFEGCLVFGTNGDGHALLAFGHKNLPRRKSGLLERHLGEVDFAPVRVFGHLTDGGRKSAGAVVGDARDQSSITGFQHHVEHFLLRNGVANLNGA